MEEGNAWRIQNFISSCETAYQLSLLLYQVFIAEFIQKPKINLIYSRLVKKVEYKHRGMKKARVFASL